jgi:hypothetical protein
MVAFAVPVAAFHSYFAPHCNSLTNMLIVNGGCGLVVGVLLSVESTYLQAQRNVFLLFASGVRLYARCSAAYCSDRWAFAGMAAGVVLSTAPVAIYRRAIA